MCIRFSLITLFPEIFEALNCGVVGRAQEEAKLQLSYYLLRDYTDSPQGRVDDRPYGGGAGMVMQYLPIARAIEAAKAALPKAPSTVVYLSPQGQHFTQSVAQELAQKEHVVLLCGRYRGVDERILAKHVDLEYSIGDYIVSGGEIPALAVIDAVTRLLPGVLGSPDSLEEDSFSKRNAYLLDCPNYTRPARIAGKAVPAVLLSGDHEAVAYWKRKQMLGKTWQKRPDLLKRISLSEEEQGMLKKYIEEN